MSAYIIVEVTINDHAAYEEYKKLTPASLLPFDGKFVVRGGACETLEGGWEPQRIVVLEFPTMERAKEWWDSDIYRPARDIRWNAADSRMICVQGI